MNDSKAIELAFTAVLVSGEIQGARLRPWQSLAEGAKDGEFDREFPQIDIRAGAPVRAQSGRKLQSVAVSIEVRTKTDDDQSHAKASAIFDGVMTILDALYAQGPVNKSGAERAAFVASLADNAADLTLSGFTIDGGPAPYDNDGTNTIGVVLNVHYVKAGF